MQIYLQYCLQCHIFGCNIVYYKLYCIPKECIWYVEVDYVYKAIKAAKKGQPLHGATLIENPSDSTIEIIMFGWS